MDKLDKIIKESIDKVLNEYRVNKSPTQHLSLNEMARVDNPKTDSRVLGNCEVWIYGQDRSSMTPHFHYKRNGDNSFEIEIRLTDFTICKSQPRNGVSRNRLKTWEGIEKERDILFTWLEMENTDYPTMKNKDVLISTWNQNNRDNQVG